VSTSKRNKLKRNLTPHPWAIGCVPEKSLIKNKNQRHLKDI